MSTSQLIPLWSPGVVKYGDTILVVGGEDDRSWMAGICWLRQGSKSTGPAGDGSPRDGEGESDSWAWSEGQELPTVMSTFGCVVANVPREVLKQP